MYPMTAFFIFPFCPVTLGHTQCSASHPSRASPHSHSGLTMSCSWACEKASVTKYHVFVPPGTSQIYGWTIMCPGFMTRVELSDHIKQIPVCDGWVLVSLHSCSIPFSMVPISSIYTSVRFVQFMLSSHILHSLGRCYCCLSHTFLSHPALAR